MLTIENMYDILRLETAAIRGNIMREKQEMLWKKN